MHRQLLCGFAALFLVTVPAIARADDASRNVDLTGFGLVDAASGRRSTLRELAGAKATLVFFSSNECPVALAYEQELATVAPGLESRGVKLVAVSSSYTATRDAINQHRLTAKLPYPLYQDAGGHLAAALHATRTSEVVLLAADGRVAYQGRIDDRVTPLVRRAQATTHELADAVDALLGGQAAAVARTQAAGCVISRPRMADRESLPGDRGFASWAALAAWSKEFQARRTSK